MATAKKQATPKSQTAKKAVVPDAPAWHTIHIFGYGETQIVGGDANGKVPNQKLKTLASFIDSLAGIQQKGTKINTDQLHTLSISNGGPANFMGKKSSNKNQKFAWDELDSKQIEKLAKEIISKLPDQKTKQAYYDTKKKNDNTVNTKQNAPAISLKIPEIVARAKKARPKLKKLLSRKSK